jgi:hypothetical protein
MAQIGDVLYLKSGSQPMTVVQGEHGDSKMVSLMTSPGVTVDIPADALTDTDPGPAMAKVRAEMVAALNPTP